MASRLSTPPSAERLPFAAAVLSTTLLTLFSAPALGQFAPPLNVDLGVGIAPDDLTGIASGDLDGDGFGDVLGVDDRVAGNVGVARGQAGLTFTLPILSGPLPPTSNGTFLPVLGDFDLDGILDVALAADVAGNPTVLVLGGSNANPGAFNLPGLGIQAGLGGGVISSLRVTDVNGDGEQDIICAVIGPNRRITTMPGAGGLTFGPLVSSSTAVGPADIDVCIDLDDDGDKDMVVCGLLPGGVPAVEVLRGGNDGTFGGGLLSQLPPGCEPIDVHWIDCDQDRDYDLFVACTGANQGLLRLLNSGPPSFFPSTVATSPLPVVNVPNSLLRLEVDFDGVEDLSVFSIVASPASVVPSNFQVFKVLACAVNSLGATQAGSIAQGALDKLSFSHHAATDADFDGRKDLVLSDQSGGVGRVQIHRNVGATNFTVSPIEPLLADVTPFTFRLEAPPALAGAPFVILFSAQGTVPGIPVQNQLLSLNGPFLPITITGNVGPGGLTTLITPPVAIPAKPTGFSLQLAAAALVAQPGTPGKIAFISKPAVITMP
jgi:hypothetical protein